MWYFTWIIGMGAALSFGIINAMWLDSHHRQQQQKAAGSKE